MATIYMAIQLFLVMLMPFSFAFFSFFVFPAVLDVYVLSTDGHVQDFRFPQTSKGGATIQLPANTVKLNSKNGEKKTD